MKKLLFAFALVFLGGCASMKQSLIAEVDAKYDKFTGNTVFESRPNWLQIGINLNDDIETGGGSIQVKAECPGNRQPCRPDFIEVIIEVEVYGRTFDDVYEIPLLADEKRLRIENVAYRIRDNIQETGKPYEAKFRDKEILKGRITVEDLQILANAKRIEGKLGDTEFRVARILPQKHLYEAVVNANYEKVYFE